MNITFLRNKWREEQLKKILTLSLMMIFVAGTAYAGLVETLGIGAKETAQGKAVAAQADTPFAVYYNPAGLTQIERPTITAGALVYDAQVYNKNFKLLAAEDGFQMGADGSVVAQIKKGDVINDGWETGSSTDNDPIVNPSLGYAMPLTDRLSFGVAAYAPYGLHIESPHDPYENPISFYAWESLYARKAVTPTLAYKVSDKLSVGFGVSLGQSESDAGKTYRYNPFVAMAAKSETTQQTLGAAVGQVAAAVPGGAEASDTAAIVTSIAATSVALTDSKGGTLNELSLESQDDFNMSWNAGVMYKPTDKISLGLTYRSRATGDFEGDVLFRGTKIGSVVMDYDHPESVQGGVRYAFSDNFSVEFDLTWTRWSINEQQVEKMTLDEVDKLTADSVGYLVQGIQLNTTLSDTEKAMIIQGLNANVDALKPGTVELTAFHHRDWDDTFQYQLGAEWLVNDKLSLRGGFVYDPTPVPDSTFDQGWPDTDRTSYAFGLGYEINDSWTIDAVIQYIKSTPARDVSNSGELDHGFNNDGTAGLDKVDAAGNPIETTVTLDDNEGVLLGGGITVSYKF
jgi:long-chain fatty acid transport protein